MGLNYLRSYTNDELTKMKLDAQNLVLSLGLGITFCNVFNKSNNRARKEPDRYLVCLSEDVDSIEVAMAFMRENGYLCSRRNNIEQSSLAPLGTTMYNFRVDLFSLVKSEAST